MAVIWMVMGGIAFLWFKFSNTITPPSAPAEADEIGGLDLPEMGALAYPEFEFAIEHTDPEIGERAIIGSSRGSAPHEADPSAPYAAVHSATTGRARRIRARPVRALTSD